VNDNAAFSRRGKGGAILEPVHLTGAIFRHGEARPTERQKGHEEKKTLEADPQLHSHALLFNWAERADGTWGSIDGRQLFRWKMATGAVYRENHPGQSIAVLAKSNTDVRALNTAIRAELRRSGQLRGDDFVIRAADRSGGVYELAIAKGIGWRSPRGTKPWRW
jgi:hypothetical protein